MQWSTKISVTPSDYFRGVHPMRGEVAGYTGTDKPSSSPSCGRSIGGQDTAGDTAAASFVKYNNIITNLNKNNRDRPSEIKASDVNGDPENWTCATVSVLESFPVAPCVSIARAVKWIRTDVFFFFCPPLLPCS